MNRHNSRIIIVAALYNLEISDSQITNTLDYLEFLLNENQEDYTSLDSFISESITFISNNLVTIDETISKNLVNYSINGLSYVDRAIIRLATYELLYTKTPPSIIINEAVELTKEYSDLEDGNQSRFNNRLLDNIKECIINARQ